MNETPYSGQLGQENIPPSVLAMIPVELIEKRYIFPFRFNEHFGCLSVATSKYNDVFRDYDLILKLIQKNAANVKTIELVKVDFENFQSGYSSHFHKSFSGALDDGDSSNQSEKITSAQRDLANNIIKEAIERNASDIHITPRKNGSQIQFRIDGKLYTSQTALNATDEHMISNVYKRNAGLEPNDLIPQDGRFSYLGKDIRLSTSPYGNSGARNKIVMRIIGGAENIPTIEELHFHADEIKQLRHLMQKPSGIILVCGPTGEGKSTTLYSILSELKHTKNQIIFTLEDPIEKFIDGVAQCQVHYSENEKNALTFAKGLRSALRQDPDVIQVGEIRDGETALTSVQASQTGHLILSTLHVSNSISVFRRLEDMGANVNSFVEQIVGIVSQRLISQLCPHCRRKIISPYNEFLRPKDLELLEEGKYSYVADGCDKCNHTGIVGRIPLIEIIEFNNYLRDYFSERHGLIDIEKYLRKHIGFKSLWDKGMNNVVSGNVSLMELLDTLVVDETLDGDAHA